jgi:hypothetical protein
MGKGVECDWRRRTALIRAVSPSTSGSKDSANQTRVFQLSTRARSLEDGLASLSANGNCETCQAAFGYLWGACCLFISSCPDPLSRYPTGPPLDTLNLGFTSPAPGLLITINLDMANTSCPVYSIIASHSYTSRLYPWETSCPKLHLYLLPRSFSPTSSMHCTAPSESGDQRHSSARRLHSSLVAACLSFLKSRLLSCIFLTPNLTSPCHRASTISLP